MIGSQLLWLVSALANWIDRQFKHADVTQMQSRMFIHRLITNLMDQRSLSIEELSRQKFRLAPAVEEKFRELRRAFAKTCYQRVLFDRGDIELAVSPTLSFHFDEGKYTPSRVYDGSVEWRKHLFPVVGHLDQDGEEHECAMLLDSHPHVKWWLRNIERRPDSSFWLQTATDRFYPDFVLWLNDGRKAVIEYKGEHLWTTEDSREKRAIGELWAELSGGSCLFAMLKGPDWAGLRNLLTEAGR